jgi:hypothetical protein
VLWQTGLAQPVFAGGYLFTASQGPAAPAAYTAGG